MFQKMINKLNDLRPRQLLMLASGAALLMFLAIYITMSFLQREEIVKEIAEKKSYDTVQVIVAKVNIAPRTRIQKNMLQVKEMPADLMPEGVIRNVNDVLDVQVKASIYAGDILTIQKVFAEKSDEGFVATIPLDSRAVSISVNDITGVAGFAKPGDFVDLLLVEKGQYSATTSILLQNVQLLSINKDMTGTNIVGEDASTTAIKNPSIATFALRPEDVLKLISASKLGEIYMSLRPSKPQNMYVGEMEYTLESVNIPPQESKALPTPSQVQTYEPTPESVEPTPEPILPAIPSNQPSVVPLPQIPAPNIPPAPPVPKIEIIQGDQVIQEAEISITPSMPLIPSEIEAPAASLPVVGGSSQITQ